jgi:hypothetical protein
MSTHEKADYQILLDSASSYIVAHAAGLGLRVLPPQWDDGKLGMTTATHRVRIATRDAAEELQVPHEWLSLDSEGHDRFRTEVEATLARLKASSGGSSRRQ